MPTFTCLSPSVMAALADFPGMDDMDLSAVPPDFWPTTAQNSLSQVDPAMLLAADAMGNDVRVSPSTVAGGNRGVFALRRFEVGEHILPFFGQVVHHDLDFAASSPVEEVRNRIYGSGAFWTSAVRWGRTSVELPTSYDFWRPRTSGLAPPASSYAVATKRCLSYCPCFRSVWLVPAHFCAAGVVNDYRHVQDKRCSKRVGPVPMRQANTELVQKWDPVTTASELTQAGSVLLVVTRVIHEGQEMFADYGPEYGYF